MSDDCQEEREVHECDKCGHIEHKEQEVSCWECGKGEMIYKGKYWFDCTPYKCPPTLWEEVKEWCKTVVMVGWFR